MTSPYLPNWNKQGPFRWRGLGFLHIGQAKMHSYHEFTAITMPSPTTQNVAILRVAPASQMPQGDHLKKAGR